MDIQLESLPQPWVSRLSSSILGSTGDPTPLNWKAPLAASFKLVHSSVRYHAKRQQMHLVGARLFSSEPSYQLWEGRFKLAVWMLACSLLCV